MKSILIPLSENDGFFFVEYPKSNPKNGVGRPDLFDLGIYTGQRKQDTAIFAAVVVPTLAGMVTNNSASGQGILWIDSNLEEQQSRWVFPTT